MKQNNKGKAGQEVGTKKKPFDAKKWTERAQRIMAQSKLEEEARKEALKIPDSAWTRRCKAA